MYLEIGQKCPTAFVTRPVEPTKSIENLQFITDCPYCALEFFIYRSQHFSLIFPQFRKCTCEVKKKACEEWDQGVKVWNSARSIPNQTIKN